MEIKTFILHLQNLLRNQGIFRTLLTGLPEEEYRWKPTPDKWCLLEIVCHLYDEEREDFRARTRHVLENPELPLPPFDPVGVVTSRNYVGQDFEAKLDAFLQERTQSLVWLQELHHPDWNQAYQHPKYGPMSAELFLTNWVAHDYLHIRQILHTKHQYLQTLTAEKLNYAGDW